jgi:hypothetical protein
MDPNESTDSNRKQIKLHIRLEIWQLKATYFANWSSNKLQDFFIILFICRNLIRIEFGIFLPDLFAIVIFVFFQPI